MTTTAERKRANYRRRLQAIRDAYSLPAMTNRQRESLLDAAMRVSGDSLTDSALRTLHALTTRGLFDTKPTVDYNGLKDSRQIDYPANSDIDKRYQ